MVNATSLAIWLLLRRLRVLLRCLLDLERGFGALLLVAGCYPSSIVILPARGAFTKSVWTTAVLALELGPGHGNLRLSGMPRLISCDINGNGHTVYLIVVRKHSNLLEWFVIAILYKISGSLLPPDLHVFIAFIFVLCIMRTRERWLSS